jgi:flagellin-specific chaperone FliS
MLQGLDKLARFKRPQVLNKKEVSLHRRSSQTQKPRRKVIYSLFKHAIAFIKIKNGLQEQEGLTGASKNIDKVIKNFTDVQSILGDYDSQLN